MYLSITLWQKIPPPSQNLRCGGRLWLEVWRGAGWMGAVEKIKCFIICAIQV